VGGMGWLVRTVQLRRELAKERRTGGRGWIGERQVGRAGQVEGTGRAGQVEGTWEELDK